METIGAGCEPSGLNEDRELVVKMNSYVVTLRHDAGVIGIRTAASNAEDAVALVCRVEGAPFRAVISVSEVA